MHLLQLQHANELQQLSATHEADLCEMRRAYDKALLEQQRSTAAASVAAAAAAEETLQSSAEAFTSKLREAEITFKDRLDDAKTHAANEREALLQA